MSGGLFPIIALIPMIAALWAFAGLRDLVTEAKSLGLANADELIPADKPSMDNYMRNPISGTMATPKMLLATLRFVATPQSAARVERLRRQYLVRLASLAVSLTATVVVWIVLSGR